MHICLRGAWGWYPLLQYAISVLGAHSSTAKGIRRLTHLVIFNMLLFLRCLNDQNIICLLRFLLLFLDLLDQGWTIENIFSIFFIKIDKFDDVCKLVTNRRIHCILNWWIVFFLQFLLILIYLCAWNCFICLCSLFTSLLHLSFSFLNDWHRLEEGTINFILHFNNCFLLFIAFFLFLSIGNKITVKRWMIEGLWWLWGVMWCQWKLLF